MGCPLEIRRSITAGLRPSQHAEKKMVMKSLAQVVRNGVDCFFAITEPNDYIQRHHLQGRFYEEEELAMIERLVPQGSNILDIGSNIGNHTVFFAKHLNAKAIIPFEVNPKAAENLIYNVQLNGLSAVDLSYLGVGLGDKVQVFAMDEVARNSGANRLLKDKPGNFITVRGDDLVDDFDPDFVKMDVEGLEIECIDGLRATLDRSRPALFIEVWNGSKDKLVSLLEERHGYRVVETFRRYKHNINIFFEAA